MRHVTGCLCLAVCLLERIQGAYTVFCCLTVREEKAHAVCVHLYAWVACSGACACQQAARLFILSEHKSVFIIQMHAENDIYKQKTSSVTKSNRACRRGQCLCVTPAALHYISQHMLFFLLSKALYSAKNAHTFSLD